MVTVSNLIILEINPFPLFAPAGDVTRWAQARRIGIESKAKRRAPINKRSAKTAVNAHEPRGSLRKGISSSYTPVGGLQFAFTVSSSASYSLYVIQGTSSPIRGSFKRAARGRFAVGGRNVMVLPPGLGYGESVHKKVSGQKANDFLSRAVTAEAASHSALLGYDRT